MKVIITWDNGIELVFTDIYKYLDYCERVLWNGDYREGWDYTKEVIYNG